MQSLVKFVKFLWFCVVRALSFAISAPGLLLTSIVTLGASVSATVHQVTTAGSSLASATSSFGQPLGVVTQAISELPSIFQWLIYLFSLDVAFDGLLAVIGVVVPLSITLATFVFITLPLFFLQYYTFKFAVWFATCVMPPNWVPSALVALAHHNPFNAFDVSWYVTNPLSVPSSSSSE